jgi:hypothetical protein
MDSGLSPPGLHPGVDPRNDQIAQPIAAGRAGVHRASDIYPRNHTMRRLNPISSHKI